MSLVAEWGNYRQKTHKFIIAFLCPVSQTDLFTFSLVSFYDELLISYIKLSNYVNLCIFDILQWNLYFWSRFHCVLHVNWLIYCFLISRNSLHVTSCYFTHVSAFMCSKNKTKFLGWWIPFISPVWWEVPQTFCFPLSWDDWWIFLFIYLFILAILVVSSGECWGPLQSLISSLPLALMLCSLSALHPLLRLSLLYLSLRHDTPSPWSCRFCRPLPRSLTLHLDRPPPTSTTSNRPSRLTSSTATTSCPAPSAPWASCAPRPPRCPSPRRRR